MTQNKQSLITYGAAAALIALLSTGLAYYLIEDDRKVQRRKTARRADRNTLKLLKQIGEQQQAIESSISSVEPIIELDCDDKAFKQKEFTLAQSNELLLRLMEQLDALQPLKLIAGELEPTEFEEELAGHLKSKKRTVIDSINKLFRRLDVCNEKMKKETAKREETARIEKEERERVEREEKARAEREEEERLAREEEERKIEEERVLRAKEEQAAQEEALRRQKEEEQERVAQEEALRRQKEEEEELVQQILYEKVDKTEEEIKEIEQVEVERPEEGSGIFVQAEPTSIELSE